MLSRLLNLCGVYLGDERDMVPAQESNLAGHWEHAKLVDLNNQVLAALGATWQEPPLPPAEWEQLPEVAPLRKQAVELVRATFASPGKHGWGWKDPRTSLTVPFWRAVLPDTRYVICVRNPLDVAASLAARDHMSARKALALWHWYTDAALRTTHPKERIVVFYERFFPDVREALSPVLAFLGLPAVKPGSELEKALCRFADADLTHHSHSLDDVLAAPDMPTYTRELYRELLAHAAKDGTLSTFTLPPDQSRRLRITVDVEAHEERTRQDTHLMDYIRKLEAAMKSYREAQERTDDERDEALTHLRDVEHALELARAAQARTRDESQEATVYAHQLESALEHVRTDRERLDAERKEALTYVQQLEHAQELVQTDRARIDAEREEAIAYVRQVEHALELLRADRDRVDAERVEAVKYVRDLEHALDAANEQRDGRDTQAQQANFEA